jgi:hypothetical protein
MLPGEHGTDDQVEFWTPNDEFGHGLGEVDAGGEDGQDVT